MFTEMVTSRAEQMHCLRAVREFWGRNPLVRFKPFLFRIRHLGSDGAFARVSRVNELKRWI